MPGSAMINKHFSLSSSRFVTKFIMALISSSRPINILPRFSINACCIILVWSLAWSSEVCDAYSEIRALKKFSVRSPRVSNPSNFTWMTENNHWLCLDNFFYYFIYKWFWSLGTVINLRLRHHLQISLLILREFKQIS